MGFTSPCVWQRLYLANTSRGVLYDHLLCLCRLLATCVFDCLWLLLLQCTIVLCYPVAEYTLFADVCIVFLIIIFNTRFLRCALKYCFITILSFDNSFFIMTHPLYQTTAHHPHDNGAPIFYSTGKDGVDPITHHQVPHTKVDFRSTMWSYENCKATFDHPFTVRTLKFGTPCYMYAFLKLVPGMYICTVCSRGVPTCRLEIIQREKDYDNDDSNNWKNKIVHRHGCLCAYKTDLKILVTSDTDVELRIVFDPYRDMCVPSFDCMEVRVRRNISMPMKTSIRTGLYKASPLRYNALDLHKVQKKIHYIIQWLKTLEQHLNDVLRMIANPVWDIDDNTNAFDYAHFMQEIQNAITTDIPESFVAKSFCFSVFLCPGLKVPLLSQTLVKELTTCINMEPVDTAQISRVFRHSLKYINFMVVEYLEFKGCIETSINKLKSDVQHIDWNTIKVDI
jgi:hypothetical protein